MKPNQGLLQRIRLTALAVGLMVLSLAGTHQAHANSVPFSHLFVYGDSLSDTGRYFYLSGGAPAPPYVDGRYSDGPLWVEYLAASLRMEYQSADNFAVAGATTGDVNYNDRPGKEYPGLLDEIASFEALGALNEPERALYIVWAGANDFFVALNTGMDPAVLIGHGVHNTMTAVSQLAQLGARHILVINVPDLGVTPYARSLGQSGSVTLLSALYNQALAAALDELAEQGIETIRFDAFSVLPCTRVLAPNRANRICARRSQFIIGCMRRRI
jgi:phospholipase/lecithinase/hemolysin